MTTLIVIALIAVGVPMYIVIAGLTSSFAMRMKITDDDYNATWLGIFWPVCMPVVVMIPPCCWAWRWAFSFRDRKPATLPKARAL